MRVGCAPSVGFEEEGGELVLVVHGTIHDLRFRRSCNASTLDDTSSGFVRERAALGTLVRNKWFSADQSGGQLRIKLGERARKVREGKRVSA